MSVDLFGVSRGLTRLGRLDAQQRDGGWVVTSPEFWFDVGGTRLPFCFFLFVFSILRFTTRFFQIQECQFLNSRFDIFQIVAGGDATG